MKLTFPVTSSEHIKGVTGDNGYSYQNINAATYVQNGDSLAITFNPNAYIVNPIWRLVTEDGRVLDWPPIEERLTADQIIDRAARELAAVRPA